MSPRLLSPPFDDALLELVRCTSGDIWIASPWIKLLVVAPLLAAAPPEVRRWRILTRGIPLDFARGASDLDAIELLIERGVVVHIHQRVHAKAYVAGPTQCLVGSNNLTVAGTRLNLELAVAVNDPEIAAQAAAVLDAWMATAKPIDREWCREVRRMLASLGAGDDTRLFVRPELLGPDDPLLADGALFEVATEICPDAPAPEPSSPLANGESPDPDLRYTDVPMPESWLDWLPTPRPLLSHDERDPSAVLSWLDEALGTVDQREHDVLLCRFSERETLEDIGRRHDVTRERIRQIEADALDCIRINAPPPDGLLSEDPDRLLGAWRAAPGRARRLRAAISIAATMVSARVKIAGDGERLAVARKSWLDGATVELRRLFSDPRYRDRESVARALGIHDSAVRTLVDLVPSLELAGALVGWRWSKRDRLTAIARLAAQHGVVEWHASAMAKALAAADPVKCTGATGRLIISYMTRDGDGTFATTGRKGEWTLAEHGDGHRTTLDAIVAVLLSHDCPLHADDVHGSLQRDIPLANVYALLRGNSAFRAFQKSVFGLADQTYASRHRVGDWVLSVLGASQSLPLNELKALATQHAIAPHVLRGVAQLDERLRYVPGNARSAPRVEQV